MQSVLTVMVPAGTHDLTALSTVKAELGIDAVDIRFDSLIANQWIPQASAAAATYCNRVFARETVLETFRNVKNVSDLALRRYPVASIASVTEDGTSLAASDYEIDAQFGIARRLSSDCAIDWCANKIAIQYVGGYPLAGDLPGEIERATILIVKYYRYMLARDPLIKRENIPGVIDTEFWVNTDGGPALPREATELLDPYRNHLT